jgi:hypothetical protein
MDIKTFINVVSRMPADISVLARGATGVGKSDIFHQIGNNLGLPVIDRRLSQMTEGDILGLPELKDGITRFAPVDWFVRACNEPVVLFLDEINRASVEVQQCAFQIVLDRQLNGMELHPDTRIYSAINEGSEYQVNEMGPALMRRFWTVDLEPTTEDWLKWAAKDNRIDNIIIEFIQQQPAHLRHKGEMEPCKVYPNPASWDRLNKSLVYAGMNPSKCCGSETPSGFYALSLGFVGVEASIAFNDFVQNYERQYSAESILDNWDSSKDLIRALSNDKHNDMIKKLVNHCGQNDWTVSQADNACKFVKELSGEMIVSFFNEVMDTENLDNIRRVHKIIGKKVVDIVNASEKVDWK